MDGGKLDFPADSGLDFGATDGGLERAAAGGLVPDRGWTLSWRIPSLQLSPMASGRSTGDGSWPRSRTKS